VVENDADHEVDEDGFGLDEAEGDAFEDGVEADCKEKDQRCHIDSANKKLLLENVFMTMSMVMRVLFLSLMSSMVVVTMVLGSVFDRARVSHLANLSFLQVIVVKVRVNIFSIVGTLKLLSLLVAVIFLLSFDLAIRQALRYLDMLVMHTVMVLVADRWVDGMLGAGRTARGEALMVVRVVSSEDLIDQQHHAVANKC
jgi:hypothetical protein